MFPLVTAGVILIMDGTAGMVLTEAGALIGAVRGAIGILTGVLGAMIRGIGAGVGVTLGAGLGDGMVLGVLMAHMVRGVLGVRGTIGIGGVIMATGHGTAAALSSLSATTENTLLRQIALRLMALPQFIEALAAVQAHTTAAPTAIRSTASVKVHARTPSGNELPTSLLVSSDHKAATTTAAVIMAAAVRVIQEAHRAAAATLAVQVTTAQLLFRDKILLRLHLSSALL